VFASTKQLSNNEILLVTLFNRVADPGCLSRIPDPDFFTHPGSRISDSGSATLLFRLRDPAPAILNPWKCIEEAACGPKIKKISGSRLWCELVHWKKSPIAEMQRWKLTNGREEKLDSNSDTAFGKYLFRIRKCFQRSVHKL
jgi:hypothetical protein